MPSLIIEETLREEKMAPSVVNQKNIHTSASPRKGNTALMSSFPGRASALTLASIVPSA